MKKIRYEIPLPQAEDEQFFARRVRKWVLCPESDKVLTEEIKAGKWPEFEVLLEELKID